MRDARVVLAWGHPGAAAQPTSTLVLLGPNQGPWGESEQVTERLVTGSLRPGVSLLSTEPL